MPGALLPRGGPASVSATSGGSVPGRAICHSAVEIVVAPHHGFGRTGGAARVNEDEVVARRLVLERGRGYIGGVARQLVAVIACAGDGIVVAGVGDTQEQPGPPSRRQCIERLGDGRREVVMEHERPRVGIVEEIGELAADIPIIDVDRHAAAEQRAVERLDVRDAVDELDRDLVTRNEAGGHEGARSAEGATV